MAPPMERPPARHRFTNEEYDALVSSRVFPADLRIELIEGEIFEMTPIGDEHAYSNNWIGVFITRQIDLERYMVGSQNPILLPGSKPQPDLTVFRQNSSRRHPRAEDVLLVIEISDTTLGFDRSTKLRMYAAAAIPEYWIIDLASRHVECYTDPIPEQKIYGSKRTLDATQHAAPRFVEGVSIDLSKIF